MPPLSIRSSISFSLENQPLRAQAEQGGGMLFATQQPDPQAPLCPLCAVEMSLKNIHRQKPKDHFIFKCRACQLEYPVIGSTRE